MKRHTRAHAREQNARYTRRHTRRAVVFWHVRPEYLVYFARAYRRDRWHCLCERCDGKRKFHGPPYSERRLRDYEQTPDG